MNPEHVLWQKRLYDSMKIGGVWEIPATGTLVKKVSEDTIEIVFPGNYSPKQLKMVRDVIDHSIAAGFKVKGNENRFLDFGGGKTSLN